MVHIAGEIVINRPIETVFDFLADERNEPRYNPGMVSAEIISNVPISIGTRFSAVTTNIGWNSGIIIEITEYDPPGDFQRRHIHRQWILMERSHLVVLMAEHVCSSTGI